MGSLFPGGRNSMSPLPSSASAPFWSRIVRLSTLDATRNAIRLGKFALMRPVITFTDGPLGREEQMDPDRAGLLGQQSRAASPPPPAPSS